MSFHNRPTLDLLVDAMPKRDDMVFEKRGDLYFGEKEGLVEFFSYSRPGQGYGGRVYTLRMEDGSTAELKGPWSSRAGAMNAAGFTHCLDVAITDDEKAFKRGHTFYSAAVTKATVDAALDLIDFGEFFARRKLSGEIKDEKFIFPPGSKFVLADREDLVSTSSEVSAQQSGALRSSGDDEPVYEPAVRLPDGTVWSKPS